MDVKEVRSALEAVESGEEPRSEEVEYLEQQGLVDVMSKDEHQERRRHATESEVIDKELGKYREVYDFLGERTDELDSRINSVKGALKDLLTLRRADRKEKYEILSEMREGLEEDTISPGKEEIQQRRELEEELDRYVETKLGHVDVSGEGYNWMEEIDVREDQIGDRDFQEFVEDVESFYDRLDDRYEQFLGMRELFEEDGFDERDSKVIDAALSLSLADKDQEDIYDWAMEVNSFLYEHDWKSYDRLRVVSKLAKQEGDTEEVIQEFDEVYDKMIEDGHSSNYKTLVEAAQLREALGETAEEKYDRFMDIRSELGDQGWSEGKHITNYIASKLAQREGKPEELAEEHHEVDSSIWGLGFTESSETGFAALTLTSMDMDRDEQLERMDQAYELMTQDGRWSDRKQHYPAAAATALMPSTPGANVKVLDDFTERLKEDGFKNVTDRAVPLIVGAYQDTVEASLEEELSDIDRQQLQREELDDSFLLDTAVIYTPLVLEALDNNPSMMDDMSSLEMADLDFDTGMNTGFDTHEIGGGLDTGVGGGMDMGGGGMI